jgi:hypothetical protein
MMLSIAAAALRQLRFGVRKDCRRDQREAEHSQQKPCKCATHPRVNRFYHTGGRPTAIPARRPTIIVNHRWRDSCPKDLRYSFRSLRRDVGFATFAILIVGLGSGASSTLFSVANALLLRPLPFHGPQRLVWVTNRYVAGLSGQTTQVDHLIDLRAQNHSFIDMAGYFAFYGVGGNVLCGQTPERVSSVPVSCNFFPVL